jgi:ADP-ribose pyrophosphatase YjhB (NUDIX family)
MKFCSHCGASLRQGIPEDDDRPRHICDSCGIIHYQHPKIIAGCLPIWGEQILLCRRAIPPRKGFWTLPAGFMEMGETLEHAASREAHEEANVSVEMQSLFSVISLPHISQVYVFFLANMTEPSFSPGRESLETQLFTEAEIPWREISFETVYRALKHYFSDRLTGQYSLHMEEIGPDSRRMVADSENRRLP